MGFWNGLSKIVQGKPVFEVQTGQAQQKNQDASTPQDFASAAAQPGSKVIPEVQLDHCKSRTSDAELEVTVWVTNQSSAEIELDKVSMLGTTTELDRIFLPGEGREMRFYKGRVPASDSDDTAQLKYKQRDNGDYFQADFRLEFNYDSHGFYEVEEFHPIHPVRDI